MCWSKVEILGRSEDPLGTQNLWPKTKMCRSQVEMLGRSEDQIEGQKLRAKNLRMLESGEGI